MAQSYTVYSKHTPDETRRDIREQVAVCCWWAGLYGTRTWRRRFGAWAQEAGNHMWYRCAAFPDPPTKGVPR